MSEFHYFLDLPRELQDEIVSNAIPPLTVPCQFLTGLMISAGEHSLLSLKLSCRSIYEAVQRVRQVKAFSAVHAPPGPPIFSFNPEKDTLRVWEMRLPSSTSSRVENAAGLPVKRLISMTKKLRVAFDLWLKELQPGRDLDFQDPASPSRKLKLEKLPHLQELIIVSPSADRF
jgi:hypothetical protein